MWPPVCEALGVSLTGSGSDGAALAYSSDQQVSGPQSNPTD